MAFAFYSGRSWQRGNLALRHSPDQLSRTHLRNFNTFSNAICVLGMHAKKQNEYFAGSGSHRTADNTCQRNKDNDAHL